MREGSGGNATAGSPRLREVYGLHQMLFMRFLGLGYCVLASLFKVDACATLSRVLVLVPPPSSLLTCISSLSSPNPMGDPLRERETAACSLTGRRCWKVCCCAQDTASALSSDLACTECPHELLVFFVPLPSFSWLFPSHS